MLQLAKLRLCYFLKGSSLLKTVHARLLSLTAYFDSICPPFQLELQVRATGTQRRISLRPSHALEGRRLSSSKNFRLHCVLRISSISAPDAVLNRATTISLDSSLSASLETHFGKSFTLTTPTPHRTSSLPSVESPSKSLVRHQRL